MSRSIIQTDSVGRLIDNKTKETKIVHERHTICCVCAYVSMLSLGCTLQILGMHRPSIR